MIAVTDDVTLKEKTLILYDTIEKKTGKEMELVGYHFDHTTQKSVLGYQCVQSGYLMAHSSSLSMLDFISLKADRIPGQNPSTKGARLEGEKRGIPEENHRGR